jgi:hypothetical protein
LVGYSPGLNPTSSNSSVFYKIQKISRKQIFTVKTEKLSAQIIGATSWAGKISVNFL